MRSRGSKIEPESLQNRFRKASKPKSAPGALLRGHKIDSRSLLGASGPPKKLLESARGGPRGNLETGFYQPYPGGGGFLPLHFGAFSFEIAAGACTGCKIEGSWVLGGHSREKLKLLSTTSKLVVLKLRCAKLEAPLRGAMGDLTTARHQGR